MIAFDCVTRALHFRENFEKEVKYLKGFGALTIGEIACKRGFLEFHNKSVVAGNVEG